MTLRVTTPTSFAALIVAFLFHNIEEAIFICRYPLQSPVSFIEPATCKQFVVAVTIITALVILAFSIANRTKNTDVYLFISTAIASGLVLNAIIPHIIIALYTLHYTPGLQ